MAPSPRRGLEWQRPREARRHVSTWLVLALLGLPGGTLGEVAVHQSQAQFVTDFLTAAGRPVPSPLLCGDPFACFEDGTIQELRFQGSSAAPNQLATIPETISQASATLTLIYMNYVTVGPQFRLPRTFTALTRLQSLDLFSVLKGGIPSELSALTELTRFSLGLSAITGTIPRWVTRLEKLNYLSVYNTALEGRIPSFLCSMTSLVYLTLAGSALHGAIPQCVQNATIKEAWLTGNFLTYDAKAGCSANTIYSYGAQGSGLLQFNCLTRELCNGNGQKPPEDCAQFCGMTVPPSDAFFARRCAVLDASRLFDSGSWDISKVRFGLVRRRTCAASAGRCGNANCKAQGGWCRAKKTLCCCTAGKEPVTDDLGHIVGCTPRIQSAKAEREANTFL